MDPSNTFFNAKEMLFNHVGFTPKIVEFPVKDNTCYYWRVDESSGIVKYASTKEDFYSDNDYFQDTIYTQRFYDKHVYRGDQYTMVFCDPHTDVCNWFRVFSNRLDMDNALNH